MKTIGSVDASRVNAMIVGLPVSGNALRILVNDAGNTAVRCTDCKRDLEIDRYTGHAEVRSFVCKHARCTCEEEL
jgi:hypothetical protein